MPGPSRPSRAALPWRNDPTKCTKRTSQVVFLPQPSLVLLLHHDVLVVDIVHVSHTGPTRLPGLRSGSTIPGRSVSACRSSSDTGAPRAVLANWRGHWRRCGRAAERCPSRRVVRGAGVQSSRVQTGLGRRLAHPPARARQRSAAGGGVGRLSGVLVTGGRVRRRLLGAAPSSGGAVWLGRRRSRGPGRRWPAAAAAAAAPPLAGARDDPAADPGPSTEALSWRRRWAATLCGMAPLLMDGSVPVGSPSATEA